MRASIEHRTSVRLLALEHTRSEMTPTVLYVNMGRLASAAIRDHCVLYDLLLDALASEHRGRFFATQAAEKWLEKRTDLRHEADMRREASTREVIEVPGSARACWRSSGPGGT